jgi:[ribosomal protein S5]-alanine N-acetyltransferase
MKKTAVVDTGIPPEPTTIAERPFPVLKTARVELRELVPSDAPALLRIHSDAAYMRWFGSDPLTDMAQAEKLIETFASWRLQPNPGTRWAIVRSSDDQLIGTCGLFKWNRSWRSCTTGYELAQHASGKGYVAEALMAIFNWGFQNMQLNRIEATVSPENLPSVNTLVRAKFKREGVMREAGFWGKQTRDVYLYSLLRSDHFLIEFRHANLSDLEPLASIRDDAMRPSLETVGRYDPDRVRQRLIYTFLPQYTQLIVRADNVIGFFALRPVDEQLFLDHLYIEPESQGIGIGGIAINRIFEIASKDNKTIRVGALIGSDSNRFYTSHGFVLVSSGQFDHYYERRWT